MDMNFFRGELFNPGCGPSEIPASDVHQVNVPGVQATVPSGCTEAHLRVTAAPEGPVGAPGSPVGCQRAMVEGGPGSPQQGSCGSRRQSLPRAGQDIQFPGPPSSGSTGLTPGRFWPWTSVLTS